MSSKYWVILSAIVFFAIGYLIGNEDGWLHRVNYEAHMCADYGYLCPR